MNIMYSVTCGPACVFQGATQTACAALEGKWCATWFRFPANRSGKVTLFPLKITLCVPFPELSDHTVNFTTIPTLLGGLAPLTILPSAQLRQLAHLFVGTTKNLQNQNV